MTTNRSLSCKGVQYYSQLDEDMFFSWIKKIDCIEKFEGAGDELYLDLVDKDLTYDDIKNLLALFYRYNIDMKQLAPLKNAQNSMAFKPWQEEIFLKK